MLTIIHDVGRSPDEERKNFRSAAGHNQGLLLLLLL